MKLLAIDTATEACSAALHVDGQVQFDYQIAPQKHADLILLMVEKLLADASITLNQLDAIAFGRGPGSFTGVRIAASVTQGLAFGAEVPVIPISTLAAMAQGVFAEKNETKVLTAIDARISEVYWGAYQLDENNLMQLQGEECVIAPDKVPLPADEGWVGAGTGWDSYQEQLQARVGTCIKQFDGQCFPHAKDIITLALPLLESGNTISAEQAIPVYLRDKVAVKKS